MPASAPATGDDSSPMVDTLLKSTSYAMAFLSVDSTSFSPQGLQYKPIESQLWKGTGRPVGVEEDATRRALGGNQRETTWRDAIFEQSFSFAEHHRSDPHAILVDEIGADQRLQQRAAAPDMQLRPIRCLQPADLVHDIAAYALRGLPAESVEGARDDVFRRLVERLADRVVALVRSVGGEEVVGPTSEQPLDVTGVVCRSCGSARARVLSVGHSIDATTLSGGQPLRPDATASGIPPVPDSISEVSGEWHDS